MINGHGQAKLYRSSISVEKPKMNYEANGRQLLYRSHDVNRRVDDGSSNNGSREVTSNPVLNWAWTAAHTYYDWMDSHAPFACFD